MLFAPAQTTARGVRASVGKSAETSKGCPRCTPPDTAGGKDANACPMGGVGGGRHGRAAIPAGHHARSHVPQAYLPRATIFSQAPHLVRAQPDNDAPCHNSNGSGCGAEFLNAGFQFAGSVEIRGAGQAVGYQRRLQRHHRLPLVETGLNSGRNVNTHTIIWSYNRSTLRLGHTVSRH